MTKRFSAQTEATLRKAGWYPGRQVPKLVAKWKTNKMLTGFEMFPLAEKILLEFGGLKIKQRGPGESLAREPFQFDPTMAGYEDDRFSDFLSLVNTKLYPLGEAATRHYYWTIGENEHVYLLMDDIQLVGTNIDEALENLIIGRQPILL